MPAVDCVTFGAPCQDLSIAGYRAGMKHEERGDDVTTRSGLFFEAIRIIKEMRKHEEESGRTGAEIRPRFAVYENVKGAFTSNKGKDFQAVLTEIFRIAVPEAPDVPLPDSGKWPHAGLLFDEVGGVSVAWRLHDAQFWGVPQRRERISVVADFGGLRAGQILFESESLQGDSDESRTTEQGTSTGTEGSTDRAVGINGDIATTLDAHCMNTPGNRGGRARRCSDELKFAVDCRSCTENPYINGTLQSRACSNLNSNNVVRIVDKSRS